LRYQNKLYGSHILNMGWLSKCL